MAVTKGMKGGGYYDAHSDEQRAAMDAFLPWMEEALADLPIPAEGAAPLAFLDIGSSEGGNAIHAMGRLLTALRRRTAAPVWVFFDDLPTNDFNHLFENLYPVGRSALSGRDVFPAAIGGSAFGRIAPPRSLYVATTFNAIGFLETRPEDRLPNFILPMAPSAPREGVSASEAEREPFRLQAAADMLSFYAARAEELVVGGKLLVQVFGRDGSRSTSHGIYDVMSDALLDLVEEGRLPRQVYEDLLFPVYFRTLEELVAPIEEDEEIAGAFRIEKSGVQEIAAPFDVQLAETGDVAAWARSYTDFLGAFTESILAAAIPGELPGEEIVSDIYERIEQRLLEDPDRYEFHYISVGALLTRV